MRPTQVPGRGGAFAKADGSQAKVYQAARQQYKLAQTQVQVVTVVCRSAHEIIKRNYYYSNACVPRRLDSAHWPHEALQVGPCPTARAVVPYQPPALNASRPTGRGGRLG